VRIVLDTTILVRATEKSNGPARDLLLNVVGGQHTLLISNEILHELARVLRYPRLRAYYGLNESRIYDYIGLLRDAAEMVTLNPLVVPPIRDVHDIVVLQTAILGEANVLCTRDADFYSQPAAGFLDKAGIAVLDDVALLKRLFS
jgi:uncharacterized protein